MPEDTSSPPRKAILITVGIIMLLLILAVMFISWIFTRGVEDDGVNIPTSSQQSTDTVPNEPSNPNVTGGSTGAGNVTSNDPSIQTPSPAGGVDTNQQ